MRFTSSLVCATVVLASVATVAAKDDPGKAAGKALVRQGNALLDQGKFQPALEKFEQAYQSVASPKIFYNQAQALHGLGRNVDALLAYRRFLDEAKDAAPELRADAERQVAELSAKVARLEVRSNRQGAQVRVDGLARGSTPIAEPFFVEAGQHTLTADWEGEQNSASITATAGALVVGEMTFAPRPGKLQVVCNREGATVSVDEKEIGRTPLSGPLSIAPGPHAVALAWQGETKSQALTVEEGGTASVTLDLADKPIAIVEPPPAPPSPPPSWMRSHWAWVAAGTVVAAAAVTVGVIYGSRKQYPSATMGTQTIGN
jgi:hypothetical protein